MSVSSCNKAQTFGLGDYFTHLILLREKKI